MHQELILGIPLLKAKNLQIDWRQGQVDVVKSGQTIYLSCYCQIQDDKDNAECLSALYSANVFEWEVNFQVGVRILGAINLDKLNGPFGKDHTSDNTRLKGMTCLRTFGKYAKSMW